MSLIINSKVDSISTIAFNRPDALNAFTQDLLIHLNQTLNGALSEEQMPLEDALQAEPVMGFNDIIDTQTRLDDFCKG